MLGIKLDQVNKINGILGFSPKHGSLVLYHSVSWILFPLMWYKECDEATIFHLIFLFSTTLFFTFWGKPCSSNYNNIRCHKVEKDQGYKGIKSKKTRLKFTHTAKRPKIKPNGHTLCGTSSTVLYIFCIQ